MHFGTSDSHVREDCEGCKVFLSLEALLREVQQNKMANKMLAAHG